MKAFRRTDNLLLYSFCFVHTKFTYGSQYIFPSPTVAGLRAAELGLDVLPTADPWKPSEILRRLSGNPAICGWVDGNESTSLHARMINAEISADVMQITPSPAIRASVVQQHPRTLAAAPQVLPPARHFSRLAMMCLASHAMRLAVRIMEP